MNQYASVCTGKTIHSFGQLEAFGNTVDDKSVKTGSYQRLITPVRYSIPLQVHNGLIYIDMCLYTDIEKNNLPMIFLTADTEWNPSSLDYEHDVENWFDAIEKLPDFNCNHPFDEHGDYIHTNKI